MQVLKVRDSTAFLALTAEQRRNVFKDAAAEVSRMVRTQQTTLSKQLQPTDATIPLPQLLNFASRLQQQLLLWR
jgi:hypothetical protein